MKAGHRHLAALAGAVLVSSGASLAGNGVLLPVQDRPGEPPIAGIVQDTIRVRLSGEHRLADRITVRDEMRSLRIRGADYASPSDLQELAARVDADWLFVATLHEFRTRPVPAVILSARAIAPGSDRILWAGFRAASGLDGRRLLGRGVVESLPELVELTATRLATDFLERNRPATPRTRRSPEAYVAADRGRVDEALFAVANFDSITDEAALIRAEIATVAALAILYRRGFAVLRPDRVNEVLRRYRRTPVAGEVDNAALAALGSRLGADLVLTGTVETWRTAGTGTEPEPVIALSAHLLSAATGRILAIDGQERRGWDRQTGVGLNRTHAAGRLAEDILDTIIAEFTRTRKGSG